MNLDDAKENIQPLASGRDIHRLEAALNADSQAEVQAQLLHERRQCEEAIRTYVGDDPLAPWYDYVLWVEQSYPKSGKESALDEVIQQCLVTFDSAEQYRQDQRMVKLYIKYIDGQPNPTEHFQTLYNSGIGTRCAELYICWAYFYDLADNFERADDVYRKGKDAHAEPREQLELAHRQFGFSMSQRVLHKDKYREDFLSTMEERRCALTSLRTHRGGGGRSATTKVGSLRTGAAVKSFVPGRVEQAAGKAGTSNVNVAVFQDQAAGGGHAVIAPAAPKSVVQSIIDSSRRQENLREAGPWSKAGSSKRPLFDSTKPCTINFPILEDMDCTVAPIECATTTDLAIRLPLGHERRNLPQRPFVVAAFVEEAVAPRALPAYDKCMLFPEPSTSYSIEELAAHRWFLRNHVQNAFTAKYAKVWGDACTAPRLYPQFQQRNDAQSEWQVERCIAEDAIVAGRARIVAPMQKIYPADRPNDETSIEELLAVKWKAGELPNGKEDVVEEEEEVMAVADVSDGNDMDVTVAVKGRQSIYGGAVRKSIAPNGRKSIRPPITKLTSLDEVEDIAEPAVVELPKVVVAEPVRAVPSILHSAKKTALPMSDASGSGAVPEPPKLKQRVLFELPAATPKITGPIRKSVISALQPRIASHVAVIPEAVEEPPPAEIVDDKCDAVADSVPVIAAPVAAPSFAIFEDTIADRQSPAPVAEAQNPDTGLFKQPLPLSDFVRRPLAARSKSPVLDAGDQTCFMPNETCSTQQFNFFIKAQSISTPKGKRNMGTAVLESSPTQEAAAAAATAIVVPAAIVTPPATAPDTASAEQSPEYAAATDAISPAVLPRQLSTIMETTESAHLNSTSSDRESESASRAKSRISSAIISAAPPSNFGITLATAAPADIPSLLPHQIYEDRTVTMQLPILPHRPTTIDPNATQAAPQDRTLPPPISAMSIYQDPTEQMPGIPAACVFDRPPVSNVLCDRLTAAQQPDISLLVAGPEPPAELPMLADDSLAALGMPAANESMLPALPAMPVMPVLPVVQQPTVAAAAKPTISVYNDDDYDDMFTRTPPAARKGPFAIEANKPRPFSLLATAKKPTAAPEPADVSSLLEPLPAQRAGPFSTISTQSIHIKEEPLDTSAPKTAPATLPPPPKEPLQPELRIDAVACAVNFSFSLDAADLHQMQLYDGRDLPDDVSDDLVVVDSPKMSAAPFAGGVRQSMAAAALSTPAFEPEESIYVPRMYSPPKMLDDYASTGAAAADEHPGEYIAPDIDLDATRQVIQTHLIDDNADPFDERVQAAFLEQCDFYDYLRNLPACQLVQTVPALRPRQHVRIAQRQLHVEQLLGQGHFGHVFGARCEKTGQMWALKQQRPANLWEYYICLEIESRIADVAHMHAGFMRVDCALIGNNAGVLVSEWSRYGSLLAVCNKVKVVTGKNVAEPVVIMLSMQLLSAIDHLHACKIIHADIKPDNVLLMKRLGHDPNDVCLQLIDFGQSIDLQLYPDGQTFRSKLRTKNFVCTEMLDDRPWLHQTDLFCAASTIHTMLFGTYMNVRKSVLGYQITTNVPRYFCKWLWESLFEQLINIKDCRMMPNLQALRVTLLGEVRGEKERAARDAIAHFNNVIER